MEYDPQPATPMETSLSDWIPNLQRATLRAQGGANTHIQSNTIEHTTAPTVMDCVQALHWLQASCKDSATPAVSGEVDLSGAWQAPQLNQAWTLQKADITKAHRRIKVLKSDWRYQIAQLGPKSWWVNKVGTYGMASSQLYGGRMAALPVTHHLHVT